MPAGFASLEWLDRQFRSFGFLLLGFRLLRSLLESDLLGQLGCKFDDLTWLDCFFNRLALRKLGDLLG